MKAILFSDIDGTIIRNKVISEEDLEAIRRFRAEGNIFMLCSGRTPPSVQHLLDDHPQLECDGAVLAGGAGICRTSGKPLTLEVIDQKMIDRKTGWEIITYINENEPRSTIHWSDGERRISIPGRYVTKSGVPDPIYMTIDEWKKEDADMIVLVLANMDDSPKEAQRVQKDILERWGDKVEAFTNVHYLDISAKGANKGDGIRRAEKLLDPNARYFGVGDGFNDVPMFEAVGKDNAFFMSSGEPSLNVFAKTSVASIAECIEHIRKIL